MRYCFGEFELDSSQYELRRGGVPLRVEPRVLDLLFYMIRNRDRVVLRQELFDNLWKEKFIGDGALSRCVAEARKAIAIEGQDDPIKTIHRRGYRFVIPVTEEGSTEEGSVPPASEPFAMAVATTGPEPIATTRDFTGEEVSAPAAKSASMAKPAPARPRRFATIGGIALGSAIVLLIVIASFRSWRRPSATTTLADTVTLQLSPDLKIMRMTTSGKATDAAISSDGKFLTYVLDEGDSRSIRMRQIATDSDRELVPGVPWARKSLLFTPDGNYVVYLEQDAAGAWALHRVAALGGAPHRLIESVQDSAWSNRKDVSFASDSERVAFIRRLSPTRTALYIRHLQTQEERQIFSKDGELFGPIWTAGGNTLCHWKLPGYSTEVRLLAIPLRANESVREIVSSEMPLFVAHGMLADQRHVVGVGGRSLARTTIYLASYPAMQLTAITQGTSYWQSPSVTPDGRQLVAVRVQQNYNLWTAAKGDADQRKVTSDLDAGEGTHGIDVTANGEFLYTSRTNGEHNHVWMASPDGRHLQQLTSGSEDEYWPVASPAGSTIFYGQRQTSRKKRSMHIWRMDLESGHSTQITSGTWDMLPAITPDGRWIIYTDGGGEAPVIKRVSSSGGKAEAITAGIMFAAAISPDGKLMVGFHARTMSDQRTLVTMRLDDGSIVERFPVAGSPGKLGVRWAPGGDGLIVVRESKGVGNLWLYPLGGKPPKQLTHFESLEIQAFNVLADGKHYVFSRGKDASDVVLIGDLFETRPAPASRD
jgi:Tol biopolymer transport system component/DNA-binding winged helix-turn-helix (wHTH) protein